MSHHRENSSNEEGESSDVVGDGPPTQISRPRLNSQVSFCLPSQQEEDSGDHPLSRNVTCVSNFADPPRNRRQVFRDMSYTARPKRRSHIQGEMRPGSRTRLSSFLSPIQHRRGLFSSRGGDSNPPQPDGYEYESRIPRDQRHGDCSGSARHGLGDQFKSHCRRRALHVPRRNSSGSSLGGRSSPTPDQYRIPPPEESSSSVLDVCFQLYSLAFGDVAMWVYGASFGKTLLFFLILYMVFVWSFVLVLYLADKYSTDSACISAPEDGELTLAFTEHFEFAFELSWTTFTTVGYGNLGPPQDANCWPVRFVCSVEAILGMAFVSMCSGLFYAKLLRLLGRATVTFSSTLCVQYGKGVEGLDAACEEEGGDTSLTGLRRQNTTSTADDTFHPFPVIEFRIVNNRANHSPGKNEIWDAEVTAIAELSLENDPQDNSQGMDEFQIHRSSRWLTPTPSQINLQNQNDDNKSQKVFYKLELKPSSHPYFSRVWFVRHTLNATSPLLRRDIRKIMRDSPSGWDPELNNYQDIRECLVEFHSLQIIMSGASALSRSEVYAEKTYSYEDICIGWRFIAVCYEEESDGKKGRWRERLRRKHIRFGDDAGTRVDLSLIHDIVPQRGNDFEPVDGGGE